MRLILLQNSSWIYILTKRFCCKKIRTFQDAVQMAEPFTSEILGSIVPADSLRVFEKSRYWNSQVSPDTPVSPCAVNQKYLTAHVKGSETDIQNLPCLV